MFALIKIFKYYLPKKYLIFFSLAVILLFITGFSEIISISAIIPFLNSLQQESNISNLNFKIPILGYFFENNFDSSSSIINSALFLSIAAITTAILRLFSQWTNNLFAAKFGSFCKAATTRI